MGNTAELISSTGSSFFEDIPLAPPDPIFDLTDRFKKDTNPKKVNLGVGVYQNAEGKTCFLKVLEDARRVVSELPSMAGYLPIDGNPDYNLGILNLIFGEGQTGDACCAAVQTPGGTGALRVGAEFMKNYVGASAVYMSNPTWVNHPKIFAAAGMTIGEYSYLSSDNRTLDFEAMCNTLDALPRKAVVLLHACCHNPTGVDLNLDEWRGVLAICRKRGLIPFFDFAYQGFAEGIEEDAAAVRLFAKEGMEFVVAYSLSKNFSLYGERMGGLALVTNTPDRLKKGVADIKAVIRAIYSNPPTFASKVAAHIMNDAAFRARWAEEVTGMRDRIKEMRTAMARGLAEHEVNLSHILHQNGMFSYSGLGAAHAEKLEKEHSVYMVKSGRICVAALNDQNMGYVCHAIATVCREIGI